jgi:hypothetical protein
MLHYILPISARSALGHSLDASGVVGQRLTVPTVPSNGWLWHQPVRLVEAIVGPLRDSTRSSRGRGEVSQGVQMPTPARQNCYKQRIRWPDGRSATMKTAFLTILRHLLHRRETELLIVAAAARG